MSNISRRTFLKVAGATTLVAGASMMTGCSLFRYVTMEVAVDEGSLFASEIGEQLVSINEKLGEYKIPLPGIVTKIDVSLIETVLGKTVDDYLTDAVKNALQNPDNASQLENYEVVITNRVDGAFPIVESEVEGNPSVLLIKIKVQQKSDPTT